MADSFGINIASSVLLEIAGAIIELVKEVKMLKKQAKVLADRCVLVANEVTEVIESNEDKLRAHDATYRAVQQHLQSLKAILTDTKQEMKILGDATFWFRLLHKSEKAEHIEKLGQAMTDRWNVFKDCLAVESIAISATIAAFLQESKQENDIARQDDATSHRDMMQVMLETLRLAEENRGLLDPANNTFVQGLVGNLAKGLSSQTAGSTPGADADFIDIECQEAIQAALRAYTGERPSIGIDSSELTFKSDHPFYQGSNAEIFKGFREGKTVSIKRLNLKGADEVQIVFRRILAESRIWGQLQHPNIARFLGCCSPKDDIAYMISDWAVNGDARTYLKKPESKDASRLKILVGVARGLEYLHTFKKQGETDVTPVVHANLKGSHVLLDDELVPRISDFGITFIITDACPGSRPAPVRWSAPEVLDGGATSTKSDVYSLGMVILELLTLRDPFDDRRIPDHRAPTKLSAKIRTYSLRPPFPKHGVVEHGLPDQQCPLWMLLQKCWKKDPEERPTSTEVLDVVEEVANGLENLKGPPVAS